MQPKEKQPVVGMVSLGCPKALVDSERIVTQLRAEGYQFSGTYAGADVVIVNTCGFLDSARDESLAAIGEAMGENGRVIVTGCLGAEPEVIREKFPNVLAITGPHQYENVVTAVHDAVPQPHDPFTSLIPEGGVKLTPRHYAYLKISEGCNNRCSFCIIPSLRGDLVSRPINEVLYEAERLVRAGVKELLVISQDTSAYGVDVKYAAHKWHDKEYQTRFYDLAEALGTLGVWVRMHYVYPYPHVDKVVDLMAAGTITPYLDIPFQHAHPDVLRAMKRPGNSDKVADRIAAWRATCPDLAIRSTFIVGFPGETEEQFQYLLDWLQAAQLDRVGCFKYEPVRGAAANDLGLPLVPKDVQEDRYHHFMATQQKISTARLQAKVGRTLPVIIDHIRGKQAQARSQADAPEIDGVVKLGGLTGTEKVGDIVQATVTSATEYDLVGTLA
jgi:ribosomal protein S12 methylthiotransferase